MTTITYTYDGKYLYPCKPCGAVNALACGKCDQPVGATAEKCAWCEAEVIRVKAAPFGRRHRLIRATRRIRPGEAVILGENAELLR